jgi:hypothetical protein
VREPERAIGFGGNHRPAEGREVVLELPLHARGGLVGNEPEINRDDCLGRNRVDRGCADLSGADTADVERRAHQAGGQAVHALRTTDAELAAQRVLDRRQCGERLALGAGQRPHVVQEAGNQDVPVVVAELRDQRGGHRGRVGYPVAVVAVVQRT